MQRVTARWLASLSLARWVPRVQWSPDAGVTWLPLTLHDGSVTGDATSTVRWSSDLTVSGVPFGRGGLSPFGSRVRVFMGMFHGPGDVEEVPLGVYRVEDQSQTGVRTGRSVLKCASMEAQVIDARFTRPRSFPAGPVQTLLEQLIREVLPSASIQWRVDAGSSVSALTEERDRWGLVDGRADATSIAKSLGARVYADARGVFVVASVPSLDDPVVWTVDVGPGGALVEPQQTLTRAGVYNQVVAYGATDDGTPPVGPGIASDTDPASPTYIGGPFGAVPSFYSSKFLTTLAQCQRTAQALLSPKLGLRQQVSVTSVANYALEPGDVIATRLPDESLSPQVVDTVTYPLTGGTQSLSTRATTTRLAGQVTLAPPEQQGDETA